MKAKEVLAKEALSNIDSLAKKISEKIGVSVTLDSEIGRSRFGDPRIEFKSTENLASKSGVFASSFEEVRAETFHSSVNEKFAWLTVSLHYQLKNGGSNGVQIGEYYFFKRHQAWFSREEAIELRIEE